MTQTDTPVTKEKILAFLRDIKPSLELEGVEKLGLYGSYAKEKADVFSDIDIVIKLKKTYLSKHDAWDYFNLVRQIKSKISEKFSRKCDVLDLDSDSFIIKTIQNEIMYV